MLLSEMDQQLAGYPSKTIIRRVATGRWRGMGIRPSRLETWKLAWEWAAAIKYRNDLFAFGKADPGNAKRPLAGKCQEIATQYLVLLMAQMKENHDLRMPSRAAQYMARGGSLGASLAPGRAGVPQLLLAVNQ